MEKSRIKIIQLLLIAIMTAGIFACTPSPQLKVLIVTGQNNHNVGKADIALRNILEKPGIFSIVTATSPKKEEDMSEFIIDFTPFDVVLLNYNGAPWPEETKSNFISFVENGGGVVVYHAADNAFPEWKEYSEIIGLGGWGKRNETAGDYVYVKDGEVLRDDSPGKGGSHGPQHEYIVKAFQPEHPIIKGMPTEWLHVKDELYQQLRGPGENIEILATAFADEKYKGTGRDEPVMFTVSYGAGRIFHTVIGHAGRNASTFPAMECSGFITTLQRGTEWAATGKVTQKIPEGLPDKTSTVRWEFFEPMELLNISGRIEGYEIGKSSACFIALREVISENGGDKVKMDECHEMILGILNSKAASVDGKKVLLTEFSWIATDAYKTVYEKLSQTEELQDEAMLALERLSY